jgi:hypothetical protein
MEIAISAAFRNVAPFIGIFFFLVALVFVWRSFYKMRIPAVPAPAMAKAATAKAKK